MLRDKATSLSSRPSSSRHSTRAPLLQHTKASDCCPPTCTRLSHICSAASRGPMKGWSALLSPKRPSPITASLSGKLTNWATTHQLQKEEKCQPQHISDATTHASGSPFLHPISRRSSSRATQGGTASSPLLHPSLNSFTSCTHSTSLTQPHLLLCTLIFAHRYTPVPAPRQTARPVHLFAHTRLLNPAISALAAPAGFTHRSCNNPSAAAALTAALCSTQALPRRSSTH